MIGEDLAFVAERPLGEMQGELEGLEHLGAARVADEPVDVLKGEARGLQDLGHPLSDIGDDEAWDRAVEDDAEAVRIDPPAHDLQSVGPGVLAGAANGDALSVKRVVLRNWGFNGTLVANSVNTGNGTFQMHVTGFAGLLVPEPVTVYVAGGTKYRNGFNSLADVSSSTSIRVVGLLIKDPTSGNSVILARYIDDMD